MKHKVKEIRAKTGLSQAKFADAYHIPMRTLQDWERAVRTPPDYVIELLEFRVNADLKKD